MQRQIFDTFGVEAEQGVILTQAPSRTGSKQLVESVLFSRNFVPTYILVLLLLLLSYAVCRHLLAAGRNIETCEWLGRLRKSTRDVFRGRGENIQVVDEEQQEYSPFLISDVKEVRHESKETTSLLHHGEFNERRTSLYRRIKAFFIYQPAELPIIHRPLPPNGTSILVLSLVAINSFYLFFKVPLDLRYAFVFADRAGLLFVVNLPFLYILSAKNQPLKALLELSYESLNIFHRKLGEIMTCLALFHFTGMIFVWYSILRPVGFTFVRFITSKIILLGLFAYAAYNIIYLTSLRSFRQRCYEIFLLLHIFLQATALILLWFHHRNGRPYIAAALAIFVVDRFVLRIFRSVDFPATLTLMEDESTILVSANWSVIHRRNRGFANFISTITPFTILKGWQPGDHIFLTIPSLSRTSKFQAHPFTIASAAPPPRSTGTDPTGSHVWFSVLIRSRKGFSALLREAAAESVPSIRQIDIRLDGPYGSGAAMRMLERSDVALIIAGGSGIAVAFPLLWALLSDHSRTTETEPNDANGTTDENYTTTTSNSNMKPRSVALLWVIHSAAHRSWIPGESLQELEDKGLQLYIPPPTEEAGRPDVSGFMRRYIADACRPETASVKSGNACSSSGGSNSFSTSSTKTSHPNSSSSSSSSSNINNNSDSSTSSSSNATAIEIKNATHVNKPKPNPKIAVIASGPHPMNRQVRNTCASMVGTERGNWDIDVAVEQFEW